MLEELRVSSFQVDGFRAIRHLELPDLRRVNLFVGKNNAGKTSLLEALQFYLHRNESILAAVVLETVRGHSDLRPPAFTSVRRESDTVDLQVAIDAVEGLFHGSFEGGGLQPIRLTPEPMPSTGLTISLPWSSDPIPFESGEPPTRPVLVDPESAVLEMRSEATSSEIPLDWFLRRIPIARRARRSPALIIPSSGLGPVETRGMWDNIAVMGRETLVEDALRTVVPELERVILIGESRLRSVLCKLHGVSRPVPIKAMGDGANRVFGLAVALVEARGGALLIDEVENGLHYSVQAEVWDAIFSIASTLDVQVFATTHSWDAVMGFQEAANRSAAVGALYRLEREEGGIVYAEKYTEEEVAIAAEQQVEVR